MPVNAQTDASGFQPMWLSHELAPSTPAYGGGRGLEIEADSSIAKGDSANTLRLTLPNHLGTHVDVPAHFFVGARSLSDYGPSDWIFHRPTLVDVAVGDGELVESRHISEHVSESADLVLIRTGHEATREGPNYWRAGPGLSAELGLWIRRHRPEVRAVGMDLISVTSRLRRVEGRGAHRAFLDPEGVGEPILLIEDMKLGACPEDIDHVLVSPLPLLEADGAPVTVWCFSRGDG